MQKNYQGVQSNGLPESAAEDELHLFEVYVPSQALPKAWQISGNMTAARNLTADEYQNPKPDICISHLCAMVAGHKKVGPSQQESPMFDADFFYFNPNAGDESANPHSAVARGVFQWNWFKTHGGHLVYRGRAKGSWPFPSFANMTVDQWVNLDWSAQYSLDLFSKLVGFTLANSWNGLQGLTWSKIGVTNFTVINTTIQKLKDNGMDNIKETWNVINTQEGYNLTAGKI
ncbi:MAG: hypothetical protein M1821_001650 [Bathelium mastoideum]|nr:MAG: hypothetical protein M1821_001650 [Bathelium mastoideum]KAI9691538.1 MAG: hypothetical protein M1822_007609 [Bathelium mastoideum]